jgi:NADPH:quinone reductase-like Zn-dependent oxidoreductase
MDKVELAEYRVTTDFVGKTVVVTGAASGIGRAIALTGSPTTQHPSLA